MFHITEFAARQLRTLVEERGLPSSQGLRLYVERGGCAGLQYGMEIGEREPADTAVDRDGALVFLDTESFRYLDGCTLDYVDDLTGAGFKILNPNAARSCGCGTSFEPADASGMAKEVAA